MLKRQVKKDEEKNIIKEAYRNVALTVHPDKNPHPDAKLAFDCVQEAYAVLSSSARRESYDRGMKNREKKRWHRLKKVYLSRCPHYNTIFGFTLQSFFFF
jgi:DnaJ-class molecular chaperone